MVGFGIMLRLTALSMLYQRNGLTGEGRQGFLLHIAPNVLHNVMGGVHHLSTWSGSRLGSACGCNWDVMWTVITSEQGMVHSIRVDREYLVNGW